MTTHHTCGSLRLRPEVEADRDLSRAIYASTRSKELTLVAWPPEHVAAFIEHQFEAQRRHYRAHYPQARFDIVVTDGADVGRLYVDRNSQRINLLDVALLPAWHGRGIGRRLVGDLLAEADAAGLPIDLHVEKDNPIGAWYARCGFVVRGDAGVYWAMRRECAARADRSGEAA